VSTEYRYPSYTGHQGRSWAGPMPRATPWAGFTSWTGPSYKNLLQCGNCGPTPRATALVSLDLPPPLLDTAVSQKLVHVLQKLIFWYYE
jgi:hypothetical protein